MERTRIRFFPVVGIAALLLAGCVGGDGSASDATTTSNDVTESDGTGPDPDTGSTTDTDATTESDAATTGGDATGDDATVADTTSGDATTADATTADADTATTTDVAEDMDVPPGSVVLQGAVFKGPMVLGSTVTVSVLDADANPTGQVFTEQTSDDLGRFSIDVPTESPMLVEAQGFWFNEVTGQLSGANITLRAYVVPSAGQTVVPAYINLTNHLIVTRVRTLVQGGASFPDAIAQAKAELVAAIGIGPENLQLAGDTSGDPLGDAGDIDGAYAHALSALILHTAFDRMTSFESEIQQILNRAQADLGDNGMLDGQASGLPAEMQALQPRVDYRLIDRYLERLIAEVDSARDLEAAPYPSLGLVLDSDLDGHINVDDNCIREPNADQLDDDGDGAGDACEMPFYAFARLGPIYGGEAPRRTSVCAWREQFNLPPGASGTPARCFDIFDGVLSPFHPQPNRALEFPGTLQVTNSTAYHNQACVRTRDREVECLTFGGSMSDPITRANAASANYDTHGNCEIRFSGFDADGTDYGPLNCDGLEYGGSRWSEVRAFIDERWICGLATDDKLRCMYDAGSNGLQFSSLPDGSQPEESRSFFTTNRLTFDLALSRLALVCAIRATNEAERPGEVDCWTGSLEPLELPWLTGKTFERVAIVETAESTEQDREIQVCGIETVPGPIVCNNDGDLSPGTLVAPKGDFVSFEMNEEYICGVRGDDGFIDCSRRITWFQEHDWY